jgi:hypothetical protein
MLRPYVAHTLEAQAVAAHQRVAYLIEANTLRSAVL